MYINRHLFEKVLNKLSSDTQVDTICLCGSVVIDAF